MPRQAVEKPRSARMLRIRQASIKDLDTLVHQRRAMWMDLGVRDKTKHDIADVAYRKWVRTRLGNQTLKAWLVENRDGRIAGGGCLWLHPIQPSPRGAKTLQPYLLSMYTEPEFRRLGVASMVVENAIEWSRKKGYGRLVLHASDIGREVYGKFGFKRTWEMRLDLEKTPKPKTG